mmetsp:Transcript_96705/g.278286  ORF Transcript_96705/g.278286 Transcript_96705/m.278286 type:complete len:1057 (+) Transcript_96705:274-3444(+)
MGGDSFAAVAPETSVGSRAPRRAPAPSLSKTSTQALSVPAARFSGRPSPSKELHSIQPLLPVAPAGQARIPSVEEEERKERKWQWLRKRCRRLSESWRFAMLTTALTLYALFGDDVRLAVTSKETDVLFNSLTIICIFIFSVEIVASSIGTDEYFLGFFFFLDVGSTATLILDLTWVGNAIFCSDTDGEGAMRTGRAGKAGARASRTVRIIRLMRLAKLYKAYKTNMEKKNALQKAALARASNGKGTNDEMGNRTSVASALAPGEGEEDILSLEDTPEEEQSPGIGAGRASFIVDPQGSGQVGAQPEQKGDQQPAAETRVGKKLSDMTTRRVIILVLVMLFCMPQFTPSSNGYDEFLSSSQLGSDVVYDRWRRYCADNATSSLPWCLGTLDAPADALLDRRQSLRAWFEKELLTFIYNHHKGDFAWRLFWVGASSQRLVDDGTPSLGEAEREDQALEYIGELLRMNQERFLGPYTYPLDAWDARFYDPTWDISMVPLEEVVKQRLTEPWQDRCGSFIGVGVQPVDEAVGATSCSTSALLRCSEREFAAPLGLTTEEESDFSLLFTFDIRATTTLEAGLSILQTVFICFAVGLGALSFTKDANELLLNPIERMIAKMETIKDNPLEAMRLGDLEYKREEVEQDRRREELAQMGRCWKLIYRRAYMKKQKEPMETVMLEKTIIKLGGLLAIGFGEAGADIVGRSMQGSTTAAVNTQAPGTKVDAIIGFANIRNFVEAHEVLREKIMLFVNQVGEIVHGCVDDYHGAPNKNVGDSFMVVWRLTGAPPEGQVKIADMAIMSFVKIVAEVNKSRVLAEYRKHPGLVQRVKGFRVRLGFGLHSGWAIEGAIGSEFKIDAAYLSPNVNVARGLQVATTHYGVSMLMSHVIVYTCSQELALLCRLVDHVTLKGAHRPVRLYTLDLDSAALEVVTKAPELVSRNRFKMRQLREVRKCEKLQEDYNVWDLFSYDEDLIRMRDTYSKEFFHRFSMAYRNYEAGEWLAARDMLFTCHYAPRADVGRFMVNGEAEWPSDGPTVTLLRFMQGHGFKPPADWPGYRPLPDR